MKYLLLTYLDSITGIPATEEPCENGRYLPEIEGLQVDFYNESEWPLDLPLIYCTADTKQKITAEQPGIVEVLTKKEFLERKEAEFKARYEKELAVAKHNRSVHYQVEADPLFFKYQRGDATKEEWLAKVEEIKARFPLPEQPNLSN